jgi:hypothetical protein
MLRAIIVIVLAGFALSACASTRAADISAPQSKPKAVHVAKAKKSEAAPVSIAPQTATSPKKTKAKKQKDHWWQIWR